MSDTIKSQLGQGLQNLGLAALKNRLRVFLILCLVCAAAGGYVAFEVFVPRYHYQMLSEMVAAEAKLELLSWAPTPVETQIRLRGQVYVVPAKAVIQDPSYRRLWKQALTAVEVGLAFGMATAIVICIFVVRRWKSSGVSASRDKLWRGAEVVSEVQLAQMTSKASHPGAPQIASVPLPTAVETRHCAVVGSTGSGKSTVLRQLIDHCEKGDCAAVIYDAAGDFVAHYYSPERGDVILNPFDARCSSWNPFAEIDHPADATRLASQLIPDTGSARDSVWTMAARNLLSDIFRELWSEGRHEVGDLIEAVQSKTKDDLKVWLSATASARIFAEDADRASGSVLFMMTQVANLLQFLRTPSDDRESFSFRDHFARLDQVTGAKPWIFVPRREAYFEATKPLLSCWLDCCATSILSLDPNPRRRVWVMLDELPDLPRVDQLLRLAPQGRKFGACLVLTFQAIDQMRATYGCEGAEALLGNTNTKLFLQCVDAETRAWASKTLGEVEVEVRVRSDALDFEIGKGRTSISTNRQVRPAVMESEFRLAPHTGFLQLPDGRPIAKIKLTNAHIIARGKAKNDGFVPGKVEDTFWGRRSQQPSATSTLLPPEGPV